MGTSQSTQILLYNSLNKNLPFSFKICYTSLQWEINEKKSLFSSTLILHTKNRKLLTHGFLLYSVLKVYCSILTITSSDSAHHNQTAHYAYKTQHQPLVVNPLSQQLDPFASAHCILHYPLTDYSITHSSL